jgi:hypothetical protein
MCTATDPRSAYQISKFQNFHNFLNLHQPKVTKTVLFVRSSKKSPEFYAIKNVKKKKKPTAVFLKIKKRATAPPGTADPKKDKKVDFDFCQFFFDFCVRLLAWLLDAVRKFETFRSEY